MPGGLLRVYQGKKMRQTLKVPIDKIESYKAAFDLLDVDGSGSIGAEEIFEFFQDIGNELPYEEVMEIIKKIDYDGSGELDFEEFISVMENITDEEKIEDDEVFKAFKKFDKNKTGYISMIEYKSIVMKIAKDISEEEVDEFLRESGYKIGDLINYKQLLIKWKQELDFEF